MAQKRWKLQNLRKEQAPPAKSNWELRVTEEELQKDSERSSCYGLYVEGTQTTTMLQIFG